MQALSHTLRTTLSTALLPLLLLCAAPAAQAQSSPTLQVTLPNGYATLSAQDLSVSSAGGVVNWRRTWNGSEWKFNPQWESLSISFTNLTGSQSADTTPGTVSTTGSGGTVNIVGAVDKGSLLATRSTPFNSLKGESSEE